MAASTTVINTVARRLRDTANLAYPRALLLRYLTQGQRVINAHLRAVRDTSAVTIPTGCTLHRIDTLFGAVSEMLSLQGNGASGSNSEREELDRVPWQSIVHQDPNWLLAVGTRYKCWATIGKNLLILYPRVLGTTTAAANVGGTFVPATLPTLHDDGSDDIVLPDDLIPLLQDLTEVLGLLTGRRWSEAADPIARIQQMLSAARRSYLTRVLAGQS
jgi:hypothetical protein